MNRVMFYSYNVLCGKTDELHEFLVQNIEKGKKLFVVTLNSQIFLKAQQINAYDEALRNATFHLPDGAGVVWAIKRHCNVKSDRIPGIDTMMYLCEEAKKRGWKVYLLGAKPDVVEKAAKKLLESGVNVIGYHHGYFEDQTPAREISRLKPDLLFVGMGAPRQELWIYQHLKLPFKLAMGVGGSFDVIAGVKKRAPKFFQNLRLEWFYRWIKEPIARFRVPFDVAKFLFKVVIIGNGTYKKIEIAERVGKNAGRNRRNGRKQKERPCKKIH